MNHIATQLQTLPTADVENASESLLKQPQRLVVVIRDANEEALIASRIFDMPKPQGIPVLLVGVARDASRAAELRRKVVTIAAFLRGEESMASPRNSAMRTGACVEMQVEQGPDWLNHVTALVHTNDLLACFDGQNTDAGRRRLDDMLSSALRMPIYSFESTASEPKAQQKPFLQVAAWLSSLASIAAFLLLQARIVLTVQGGAQSALLLVTLFAEAGVIWLLNSLFS